VRRQMRGISNWEKTQHTGAHRVGVTGMTAELPEVNRNVA
jgi:hypothetical protein